MNRPSAKDGHVRMPEEEFEELLELAAERGAKRALANVGLVDEHAANDIRDNEWKTNHSQHFPLSASNQRKTPRLA